MSIHASIKEQIQTSQRGKIYFPSDFWEYGNAETATKALQRLVEQEMLIRLSHGIYYYPKISEKWGIVYPSIDEIASEIAGRDGIEIKPTGVWALNKLGLSTQVPMRVVYFTNGSPRSISVGKQTIVFKHTAPKNLLMKGEISYLVIQAMRELGEENITPDIWEKIKSVLRKEQKENILHDAKLATAWIQKKLVNFIRTQEYELDTVEQRG